MNMIGNSLQTAYGHSKKLWDDKKAEFSGLIHMAVSLLYKA